MTNIPMLKYNLTALGQASLGKLSNRKSYETWELLQSGYDPFIWRDYQPDSFIRPIRQPFVQDQYSFVNFF